MRGAQVLRIARPAASACSQAPASALTQGAPKITQGDCARTTGDGLQQQAGCAVLGILRQVDGGKPIPSIERAIDRCRGGTQALQKLLRNASSRMWAPWAS